MYVLVLSQQTTLAALDSPVDSLEDRSRNRRNPMPQTVLRIAEIVDVNAQVFEPSFAVRVRLEDGAIVGLVLPGPAVKALVIGLVRNNALTAHEMSAAALSIQQNS